MIKKDTFLKYRKSPAVKSLGIYTFTNFFGKGVAFLLLPYFTNVLSKSDMGAVTLFSNSMLFLIPFISMGVLQSASVEYFKLDKKKFRDFFTSSLLLPVIIFFLSLLVFYLGRDILTGRYKFPASFIWLVPVGAFLSFLSQHVVNMIRNEENKKLFAGVVLGRLFLEIALAVFLISVLHMAWQGRVNGIVLSYGAMLLYAVYFFVKRNYLFGQIKKQYIREELLFSIPVVVMQFSTFCMNYSDVFFLSRYTSDNNAEVGVYAIACVFASVIITLSSAFLQFIHPKIFKMLSQPRVDYGAIRRQFLIYIGAMCGGLFLLLLLTPVAYKFVINKNYGPGIGYYYLLCIAYFFWTIAYLFFTFLLYYKQKKKILLLSLSFILVSLSCNFFFIRNAGSAQGAALSVLCSYTIVLGITLLVTAKQMRFLYARNLKNHAGDGAK